MKTESRAMIFNLFVSIFLLLAAASNASAMEMEREEYKNTEALKGVKSVKAIFDVRIGDPKSAALHLKLIHQTYKEITAEKKKATFRIVFIGPSVKLVSKNRDGFSAEDQKKLDEIANTISQLAKDGIKIELCNAAARIFGVDPKSVLPEIKVVGNGWISVIGYQAKGYSLVPAY